MGLFDFLRGKPARPPRRGGRPVRARAPRLEVEALESRNLPSVSASLAGGALAVAGGPERETIRVLLDPSGAEFACTGATYTAVGGVVQQVIRDSFDATGTEHVTGTITPKGVTLTDGTSLYRLVGASWFGGSFNEATGHFVFTDTGHFNIVAADGTVVGRVSTVEHSGSNGSSFAFDFGNCEAPND